MANRIPIEKGPGRFDLAVGYFRTEEILRFTIGFGQPTEMAVRLHTATPTNDYKNSWKLSGEMISATEYDAFQSRMLPGPKMKWTPFHGEYHLHSSPRGWFEEVGPQVSFNKHTIGDARRLVDKLTVEEDIVTLILKPGKEYDAAEAVGLVCLASSGKLFRVVADPPKVYKPNRIVLRFIP